jgi:PAS domain S-box-containing protein
MIEKRKPYLENGLWKYDLATEKYEFSSGICRIFNLETQDLKSHDAFLKRIHPADIDSFRSEFEEKIKTEQPFSLNFRIVCDDGTIKIIEENVDFCMNEKGKVETYIGVISDISAMVKLQKEEQHTYTLINTILTTLPNLIFVKNIDAGFQFTFVNDKFASFYGFTADEIIGKYDKDISTPEQAKQCYITDNIASKHDITSPLVSVEEIPISKKSIKYMQTIKFAHVISGTNYLICSAMDISDLVNARQKAEESNKLKSAFLNTISHEIRTPMNSIMGFSQLMGISKDKSETTFFCKMIKDHSEQLLNLISNIVYLARLESDNEALVNENIDMESLFSEIKSQFEGRIKDKKLDFIYAPHDAPCYVNTNKDSIMELMKHFLDNAIKFTEHGSISIGYLMEDKMLRIWVKDTGIGIDKKNKRNVFRRFVKLDEFSTGTGIGLYIAQKIAKSLKGKIDIDSKIGKGTLIWADIPLETVEKAE